MRPAQRQSVIDTVRLINLGQVPSTESVISLLMAVRESTKGQLRDLADSAAHHPREKGHAHGHIKAFVHQIEQARAGVGDGRLEVKVLYPIRNIIGQMNEVLKGEGIEERIDAKSQRSRMTLAWSVAYALHGTAFDLGEDREASLTLEADGVSDPHMGVDITFPEVAPPRTHPIVMSYPWLLDEKDRTADWGQVLFPR